VPSKFLRRDPRSRVPLLYVGSPDGELARLVTQHGIGYVIEPGGKASRWANAIRELGGGCGGSGRRWGRRARSLYESRFAPGIALAEWEKILENA